MTRKPKYESATTFIRGRQLILHPLKAVFLPDSGMLICSDVHVGKAAHFRKSGIPIPTLANKENFWRMVELIEEFTPKQLVFLGDLIHSQTNQEWDDFIDFIQQFPSLEKILVRGNHDIQEDAFFLKAGMTVTTEWFDQSFRFVHVPEETVTPGMYTFAGHLHPSILMKGKAKQALRLPCFWFGPDSAVMPSFGQFTGSSPIQPGKKDGIFVIAGNQVLPIN